MSAAILSAVWISIAPLQTARQELAVAAAGGKVYAIGGISGDSVLASVEEYDPVTNHWRFVTPLPEPLHHSAAAVVDDDIYVLGGYRTLAFDATSAVYRFSVSTNAWSRLASLPSPRGALAAAVIDGRIYAVGGNPGGKALTVYDPQTDRWSELAPMPTPREHLAVVAAAGKLYVAGGRNPQNVAAFEAYDPTTDRWSALAPLPTARSGIAAAVIGQRIYVFGGEGNRSSPSGVFDNNESYDIVTDAWHSEAPMQTPRHGIGAVVIGERIFIPGGGIVQGFGATAAADAFLPSATLRRRAVRSTRNPQQQFGGRPRKL